MIRDMRLPGVAVLTAGLLLAASSAWAAHAGTGRSRSDLHRPERTEGLQYPPKTDVDRSGNVALCTTRKGETTTDCR